MTVSVLALVTDAFGGRGGIAQYNRDFLSALASTGNRVAVIPRYASDPLELPSGISQYPARPGRLAYSLAALRAALALRPELVFCGHLYIAPLGWLAAKLVGAKLVMQMHGIEAWQKPSGLVRWACERASLILNVSRYTRARVVGWANVPPERAVVLPNTVAECFSPGDGEALRRDWGLEGKKVLLTVGRMDSRERYKGHEQVIAALAELFVAKHDVVYVIAGEGDDCSRLERLAEATGVGARVRFVGALSREQLIDAYRTANLFVMPSTGEGFGIAFLEAMACGTAALGLDAAGARDALGDGELGILTSEENLAAAVSAVLSHPRPDAQMLSRTTRARFGRERFGARVGAIFDDLLKAAC